MQQLTTITPRILLGFKKPTAMFDRKPLEQLPCELITCILNMLPGKSRQNVHLVSSRFAIILNVNQYVTNFALLRISENKSPSALKRLIEQNGEHIKDLNLYKLIDDDCHHEKIEDNYIKFIINGCKNLKSLDISRAGDYCDSLPPITGMATSLLENLTNLTNLNLTRSGVTDKEMDDIGKLTTLQSLILTQCKITNEGIKKLTNLKQLRVFGLRDTQVNEIALEAFAHIILNSLDLSINDGFTHFNGIENQSELQSLELMLLNFNQFLESAAMEKISKLSKLRMLNLKLTKIKKEGLEQVGILQKLEYLNLGYTFPKMDQEIDEVLIKTLGELKTLRYLSLSCSRCTDATMAAMVHMTDLEELDLTKTSISADGISNITHLTKLINLNVSENPIADEGATKLTTLTNLRMLDLDNTNITNTSIIAISATLTALQIFGLNSNAISESILDNLCQLPALHTIALRSTKINDSEVPKKLSVINTSSNSKFYLSTKNQQ